jgi:hypothetical protein
MGLTQEDLNQIRAEIAANMKAQPAKKKQVHTNWEKNMVREYIATKYGNKLTIFNARVGAIPEERKKEMYKFLRRWADAIVVTRDEIIVIEGKMRPNPGVISQLQLYMRELHNTPEFEEYQDLPIRGVIVSATGDTTVEAMAIEAGLDFEVFKPSFFDAWEEMRLNGYAKRSN